jgi:hypothetical protein
MNYIKMYEEFDNNFTQFSQLIGKIVDTIYLSEDEESLAFVTDDGECHIYTTSGDCCNSVWFYHFSGVEELLNQRVHDVESKDWRDVEGEYAKDDVAEESCIWTLKTNRGYIDIEVRNSHNGYYGGEVGHHLDKDFRFLDKSDWKMIHDDF